MEAEDVSFKPLRHLGYQGALRKQWAVGRSGKQRQFNFISLRTLLPITTGISGPVEQNLINMNAKDIVNTMMKNDFFSQWLGIHILDQREGYCKLSLTIRKDMLNGFGIAHGGIAYSLADSALAFASNSKGPKSVSIETSISHLVSLKENDEIIAESESESETGKLGHYKIKLFLKNEPEKPVALFKGIVYKTSKDW